MYKYKKKVWGHNALSFKDNNKAPQQSVDVYYFHLVKPIFNITLGQIDLNKT